MGRVLACLFKEWRRYACRSLSRRSRTLASRHQARVSSNDRQAEELNAYCTTEDFTEKRWHCIPDLALLCHAAAGYAHVVWERLNSAEFAHTEAAIVPMKGTYCWTRLGLYGP
jgi:hypothetical protein